MSMHPIAHAANRPDHPAVIMTGSGKQITYNEMDAESNRFTRLLRAHGVGAGDAFAVLLENRIEYFTLIWGSQRAGTMLVPISSRLTAPEAAYIIRDAQTKLLITSTCFASVTGGYPQGMPRSPCAGDGRRGMRRISPPHFPRSLRLRSRSKARAMVMPFIPPAPPGPGPKVYSAPPPPPPAPPEDPDPQAVVPLMGLATMGAGMPADGSMVYSLPRTALSCCADRGWCSVVHRVGRHRGDDGEVRP